MKYIVTSDIHLGHIKTPTGHIINSFKKYILNKENSDIDVLFISGDLFDRLLDLNSKEVKEIIEFFHYLLEYCYRYDIALRVLEGTPSHDWQQSEILYKLNELREHKCDLKYFKVLDIEYLEKIKKYVLYIPDEWTQEHSDLEKQIEKKLSLFNISHVDIAILHGQFGYQVLGKKYHGFFFKEDYFLSLVKGFIHVGHYHSFSSFDRIIANGSLERLAHGEEEPKGYVKVVNNEYIFIENKDAYPYVTINITKNYTLDKLTKVITSYPKGSFIRLLVPNDHSFNLNFNDIKARFLEYHLKKIVKEHIKETQGDSLSVINSETLLSFDSIDNIVLDTNIYDILLDRIYKRYELTESEKDKLTKYLEIFSVSAVE